MASVPSLANADYANNPSLYIGDITYFKCNSGYMSTGGSTNPYFQCVTNSINAGSWSDITYSCVCMVCIRYNLINLRFKNALLGFIV